jgi:hypothetical protein
MCMKTNRTRKNDMPIGRQLRRTKSDFADNCSSVRTNWVESGGLSERIWTGRTMDFRQPEHAGRGNRDDEETGTDISWFFGRTPCPCQRTLCPRPVTSVTKGLHPFPGLQNSQACLPSCCLGA